MATSSFTKKFIIDEDIADTFVDTLIKEGNRKENDFKSKYKQLTQDDIIMFILNKDDILVDDYCLQILCPKCKTFTGEMYNTALTIPEQVVCVHCNVKIKYPLQYARVLIAK